MANNTSIEVIHNYINGAFVAAKNGAHIDNYGPATGRVISHIPRSGADDVNHAIACARAAWPSWSSLSAEERADWIDKIANELERRADTLATIECLDTGKPLSTSRRVDIPRAIANFRFFAGAARHDSVEATHMADALNYSHRSSVGVAGLITPWNLPLYLLTWKVAPALAMGNTVVAKPSELSPLTANALAQICHDIKLPAGVFNLVHGLGAEAGNALISSRDVPLISFTGGTATGTHVAQVTAPMFKKLSLELGGKNATVVFADCDLAVTAAGACRAAFTNQGQVCLSGSRVFVEASIAETFVKELVKHTNMLVCGDPLVSNFGALISSSHRDKIESYVALARHEGGTIACGGARPVLASPWNNGYFYQPTIITGLPSTSRVSREEIFGPVITVHTFTTESEVLAAINGTRYGLAGSLWTNNLTRAHRIARQWETGMVWINCWLHRDLRVPFGGVKDSGIGREGGRHSLEFYSQLKNICVHHGTPPPAAAAAAPSSAAPIRSSL